MSIGIGDALRDARRRVGTSLTDASEQTRVRETYLAALEQEEFSGLGGDVYVKGFITSYAKFLQLDPEPLLEVYREHVEERDVHQAPRGGPSRGSSNASTSVGIRERPAGAAVLLVLVLLIVIALLALGIRGGEASAAAAACCAWRGLRAPGGRVLRG